MFNIFVISHGHEALIRANTDLLIIARRQDTRVLILDNLGQNSLSNYCREHSFEYVRPSITQGFGANNNYLFGYLESKFNVNASDTLWLINPDVFISPPFFSAAAVRAKEADTIFFTVNLFQEIDKIYDPNIKRFPTIADFVHGFCSGHNPATYNKQDLVQPTRIDWCSGAFMVISVEYYRQLAGFDERFFMYFEDVDLCRRAYDQGIPVIYFPEIKALHIGQRTNRQILSRHFIWFLCSMYRYFAKHPRLVRRECVSGK